MPEPKPLTHPIRRLLLPLACLALGLVLLAGCGGGDDGIDGPSASADSDPKTVLDDALGADGPTIDSGVLELSVDVAGASSSAVNASITGPFQSNGEGQLPSLDFDVTVDAQAAGAPVNFQGNLTLTPDGLFVGYGGTNFVLDEATFGMIQQSYQQSAQ